MAALVPPSWRRDKGRMGVRGAFADTLALALPPRCPGCGAVVRGDHRFCAACWESLDFLGPPWCATCCAPFEIDRGPAAQCGGCLDHPPVHAGARAAVAYGEVAKTVALRLKYGGRLAFATTAARLMERLLPEDADLLVPVPLHRWRLWSRGYNQAALIAAALSHAGGVPHDPLLLRNGYPSLPWPRLSAVQQSDYIARKPLAMGLRMGVNAPPFVRRTQAPARSSG